MSSSATQFNLSARAGLPGHLGIVAQELGEGRSLAEMAIVPELMAPNGFLHAGSVVSLADTAAGMGCLASLPPGATSFTTLELKSNHLSSAREGTAVCVATLVHGGRTTQVWDAVVSHKETGRTMAMFRCTQLLLYPKPGDASA